MIFTEKTVAFHTLGCKLNFAETSTIGRQLNDAGFTTVDFKDNAAIYIINTCSVTQNADRECKQLVKKAKLQNADSLVIIIGCYAQLKPEEIAEIDGVDLVLGAKEKFNILHFLEKEELTNNVYSCEISDVNQFNSSYSIGDRTRAFLKVQDGCDYKCTYCTIPLARGISRSDSIENIRKNAQQIAQEGIKEIVLTGVNIGDYGKGEFGNKKHDHYFIDLLKELDQIEGIERIRISSIEPNLLTDEIIEFVLNSKNFAPHFHIPLQSGSNEILALMKRRYRKELFAQRLEKIKKLAPNACIGIDVIVGFPGETEAHFLETFQFLQSLDFSYLHVFTYSERDNTLANEMPNVVPMNIRKERNKRLRILSEKKNQAFYQSQINSETTVLWEHENKNGIMFGYTENYIRLKTVFDEEKVNTLEKVYLEKIDETGLFVVSDKIEQSV